MHRDRIDTEGRLHLARIAGPDGRAVWAAPLGLSILQSVMPGTDSLVLFGRAFVQPRKEPGDPYHSSHEHVLAIDTKTGAVQTFNITTVDAPGKS